MKTKSLSCLPALNAAWSALGAPPTGPVAPSPAFDPARRRRMVGRGRQWCSPGYDWHEDSGSPGLLCSSVKKKHCHEWPDPCKQLFTASLWTLKINSKYSYLAYHSSAKCCCSPDPAAAASPAGSTVLWGVFKNIKHKDMSCCCFLRKGYIWGELLAFRATVIATSYCVGKQWVPGKGPWAACAVILGWWGVLHEFIAEE